jgi:2,4-dienoyl-CoA reductase-like NADH-dependent reductase (Old Yellow Enzyme family)
LIFQEATAVSPEGRITYADMGLWKEEHIEKLQQIVNFVHAQGAKIGVQLAHAGRKASHQRPWDGGKLIPSDQPNGWKTVAPSPIPFAEGTEAPIELDKSGIQKVIDDYVAATKRVIK